MGTFDASTDSAPSAAPADSPWQTRAALQPPAPFRLVRYFTVTSLAAFVLVAAPLMYLVRLGDDFFEQVQREQSRFFKQVQDSFTKQHDTATRGYLLSVHEAGGFNLTRLFANSLWEKDFAPLVAEVQQIPVDRCRAIADVKDSAGKTVQPAGKKACYAAIGRKIMALPQFRALDAKVFNTMKKSTVFKIKVFDLRGLTVYSSEHSQIGEDKRGNAGWESAAAGKPASELTHRDTFSAFEGVVENRDLISSYLPVLAPDGERIVGVLETYSDVTRLLEQINASSAQIRKLNAENQAEVERAAVASEAKADESAKLLLAVILGLLALLYVALYLIVRGGQRIIEKQDVERRRAVAALRESERSLRESQSIARLGSYVLDVPTGLWSSSAVLDEILGIDEKFERSVEGWSSLIHPEWQASMRNYFAGEVLGKHVRFDKEYRIIRKRDGEERWVHGLGELEFDARGRPLKMIGTISDVTKRKQSEESLRAAESQFRGLVEQAITGIYIIQDGRLAYANPRFAEIFGYDSADELIGLDPLSLSSGEDRALVAEHIRKGIEGAIQSASYRFTASRKDGSSIEVGVHGSRAHYRGRPAVIGLVQDISEKTRAEEQIQHYVAQLKTAFMSTVEVAMTLSEKRDPYTAGHARRVAEIAVAIGTEMRLDTQRLEGLRVASDLHDIGKITIPTEILVKPGKLSAVEFDLIKGHSQASYDVLRSVQFPWPVAEIALQHHERMDGSGYPQGLKGEAILLEARILGVADTVEAMSSHRPYRPGLGVEKALAEIERGRGAVYDPDVADACLRLFREKGYAIPD